ncbi:unnamed protein product [Cunninghamella blakesleeana]
MIFTGERERMGRFRHSLIALGDDNIYVLNSPLINNYTSIHKITNQYICLRDSHICDYIYHPIYIYVYLYIHCPFLFFIYSNIILLRSPIFNLSEALSSPSSKSNPSSSSI